jgi:hypothetical protein
MTYYQLHQSTCQLEMDVLCSHHLGIPANSYFNLRTSRRALLRRSF